MKAYKTILAVAILLLGFTACNDRNLVEQPTNQPIVPITIGANMAPTTRTSIASNGDVLWSANDTISVRVGDNSYDFALASGAKSTSATFRAVVTESDAAILKGEVEGTVTAYYPKSGIAVPTTQQYVSDTTFADNMNPMTATFTGGVLTFTNNAAVVRIQGVSKDATSAVLSYEVNETNYSVSMTLTAGSNAKDLYFVVVPGAKEFNLSLDGGAATKYVAKEVTAVGYRYNIETPKVARVQTKYSPAEWKEFSSIGAAIEYFNTQQQNSQTKVNQAKIELLTNVETGVSYTSSNPLIYHPAGYSEVFDLKGYTLSVTNSSSFVYQGYGSLNNGTITAANEGDVALVLKDIPTGTFYGIHEGDTVVGNVVYNNSKQTIAGGTIDGDVNLTNNSTISITGGIFKGALSAEEGSSYTITGGTFYQDPSAFVELPKEAYQDGDVWKIRDKVFEYVAEVNGTQYKTLAAAYSAVSNGGTIKMIGYTDITSKNTWNKTITLDLNGMQLTSKTSQAFYLSSGTLTVTDNSTKKNGKIVMNSSCGYGSELFRVAGGNIIINGGTFEASASTGYVIQSSSETTSSAITVNGGTFKMTGSNCYGIYNLKSQTPVNITGGTFLPTGYSAICIHMNASTSNPPYTGTLNVTGGRFELQSGSYGIRGYDKGTINIYDGAEFIVKGGTAIHSFATLLNIEGGTFTETSGVVLSSNYQKSNTNPAKISGGTFTSTGGDIFEHSSIQTLEISGGTFTAKKNYVFRLFNIGSSEDKPINISVSGGTFTDNPAAAIRNGDTSTTYNLVKSGYVSTANGTSPETWTVTADTN